MREYCEHGTYLGPCVGPDVMCGWCETGISVDEVTYGSLVERVDRHRRAVEQRAEWIGLIVRQGEKITPARAEKIVALAAEVAEESALLARAVVTLSSWVEQHPQYA